MKKSKPPVTGKSENPVQIRKKERRSQIVFKLVKESQKLHVDILPESAILQSKVKESQSQTEEMEAAAWEFQI